MIKPTKDEMMYAHSIHSSPKQLPITRHTGTTGGTIRTLPIYTSRSYVHNLRNVVRVPAEEHKLYITTSGPFVPALTNGPHVSYATRVTHMQFPTYLHIHYHPL